MYFYRSKEDGLNISDEIGKGFSGNGDQLSFTWANDEKSNVAGVASDYDPEDVFDMPGRIADKGRFRLL